MSTEPPAGPSLPPVRPATWIGGTLVVMVLAIATSVVAAIVLAPFDVGATTTNLVAGLAMSLAIIVFALTLRSRLPAFEQRLIFEKRCSWWTSLGIALALALGARIVVGIIATIGTQIDPGMCEKYAELADQGAPALWQRLALAVALVVFAPIGEELLFRGILLRGFVRIMPFRPAALLSGVLFGIAHLQYWAAWPLLIGVTVFGLAAGFAFRRYGYRTTVLAHALFNAIAAIALLADVGQSDASTCVN